MRVNIFADKYCEYEWLNFTNIMHNAYVHVDYCCDATRSTSRDRVQFTASTLTTDPLNDSCIVRRGQGTVYVVIHLLFAFAASGRSGCDGS